MKEYLRQFRVFFKISLLIPSNESQISVVHMVAAICTVLYYSSLGLLLFNQNNQFALNEETLEQLIFIENGLNRIIIVSYLFVI